MVAKRLQEMPAGDDGEEYPADLLVPAMAGGLHAQAQAVHPHRTFRRGLVAPRTQTRLDAISRSQGSGATRLVALGPKCAVDPHPIMVAVQLPAPAQQLCVWLTQANSHRLASQMVTHQFIEVMHRTETRSDEPGHRSRRFREFRKLVRTWTCGVMTFGTRMAGYYPRGKYVFRSESSIIAGLRTDCGYSVVHRAQSTLSTTRKRKCNQHAGSVVIGPSCRSSE